MKSHCFHFHFRELPSVLLPGQTEKFEIIFRPRQPGYFNETLYLMTHPRLGDFTYGIQLAGVCMDPDVTSDAHKVGFATIFISSSICSLLQ